MKVRKGRERILEKPVKRSQSRIQSGDKLGAIADLTEAIRLDPHDANSYYLRGGLRKEMGDRVGAEQDFQKVIDL